MKRIQSLSSSPLFCTSKTNPSSFQCLHTTPRRKAVALPNTAAGPPPSSPLPAASEYGERVNRRRRQAELLKRGQDLRVSHMKPGSALKKRFWKDVHVKTTDGNHPPKYDDKFMPQLSPITNTNLSNRRSPHHPPRYPPRPQPLHQISPPHPPLKTPPRYSHRPRMGPPRIRPPSPALPPHPTHLHRLPRPRHPAARPLRSGPELLEHQK